MFKRFFSIILSILILINLSGCSDKGPSRYEGEIPVFFDTITRLVIFAETKEEYDGYYKIIYDNLKEYHQLYDIFNDYEGINNIKTINDNAGIRPVKVDKKIIDLLKFSIDGYEKTGGKTNIAFGSVLKIWHKYREEGIENPDKASLPPERDLRQASEHTNIEDIIIDEEGSTVYLQDPLMSIDVGAIAKGYAAERIREILREEGLRSGILSLGGNVRVINNNIETNKAWNVGVQNPDTSVEDPILHVLMLEDKSLVTSGNYERYYMVDGEKYSHIIDTETLYPARYFSSVIVVCQDSGIADALSTAAFSMPFQEGLEFINSIAETEAMWVFPNGELSYSENFESFIKK